MLEYLQSINLCAPPALICSRNKMGDGRAWESENSKDLMTAEEKHLTQNYTKSGIFIS